MNYCVVIPSRTVENMQACIASLRQAGEKCPVIVVWDFGKARTWPDEVRPIPSAGDPETWCEEGQHPFCFAQACNIGIRQAQKMFPGFDVVLMNDDILMETPRGLAELSVQWLDYAVVSPLVRGPAMPQHQLTGRQAAEIQNVAWVPFACVYIRRAALEAIGLLDEQFRPGGYEDNDWCRRARSAGFLVGVYHGVVVDHQTLPHTFRSASSDRYDLPVNRARYIAKWGDAGGNVYTIAKRSFGA